MKNSFPATLRPQARLCCCLMLSFTTVLSGCSGLFGDQGYFRDRTLDYQEAKDHPSYRLVKPNPAVVDKIQPGMPVPNIRTRHDSYQMTETGDAPRPQVIDLVAQEGRFQVLRSAQRRWGWIEADAASAYLWVSQFMANEGYPAAVGSMVGLRLETQWQTVKPASGSFWQRLKGTKDYVERFVVDFLPTQERSLSGTQLLVEKQIRAAGNESDDAAESASEAQMPDLDWWKALASALNDQLKARLAMTAQSQISEGFSAELLVDGNGLPQLSIDRTFAPSWEVLGQALQRLSASDKSSVRLQDLDRSLSVYYISVKGEQKQSQDYQLHVAGGEHGVLVSVQVDDNTVAPEGVSKKLLTVIKKELDQIGG